MSSVASLGRTVVAGQFYALSATGSIAATGPPLSTK